MAVLSRVVASWSLKILLKSLSPQPWFFGCCLEVKPPFFFPVFYNVLKRVGPEVLLHTSTNVCWLYWEVDAYTADTRHYREINDSLRRRDQHRVGTAHTNTFRIDLHQFSQKVHAGLSGNRPYGHVFIRKLFPRNIRCTVTEAPLSLTTNIWTVLSKRMPSTKSRFTWCGAIANGYAAPPCTGQQERRIAPGSRPSCFEGVRVYGEWVTKSPCWGKPTYILFWNQVINRVAFLPQGSRQ